MSKQLDPLGTTAPELHSKKTIILIGDSWTLGEWSKDIPDTIAHRGLEQYLLDDGYNVINYGVRGASNSLSYLRLLEAVMHNHIDKKNTKVFIFWTDWHRDLHRQFDIVDFGGICKSNSGAVLLPETYTDETPHRVFSRIFEKLDTVGLPIGLIGGCSDVIEVGNAYQNLYTACQSFVNLCLNDIDTIDDPTYTVFTHTDFGAKKFSSSLFFLNDMEKANTRRLQWKQNPEWFWPDGAHANKSAHRKLYDFLKSKNYL